MRMRALNTARRTGALAPLALLCAWLAAAGLGVAAPAPQLAAPVCFPETGYCTGGRIREVWESGGGLMVFGFPITSLQDELIEGRPIKVQWFERARVELHPDNPPPYDVQVGRVGAELLAAAPARGYARTAMPGECRFFPETGASVCGEFLDAWRLGGLVLDGDPALTDAESLALYGLPVGEPRTERLSDGRAYVVQWFERARFELHPELDGPTRVLRGLLGRERAPVAVDPPGTPWAEPAPPPPPVAVEPPPPALPAEAPARIQIAAIGLDAPTIPVGADEAGEFIVPDHEVGWYMNSAAPGQGENIVLWGHVLPFLYAPHLPAPFARLAELQPGAAITLYDNLGQPHEYVVTQQIRATPDQLGYVYEQGREVLTLISCIGEGVVAGGGIVDYTERLITVAEPVQQ
jgi:sortase (surface protein transpeptidase)